METSPRAGSKTPSKQVIHHPPRYRRRGVGVVMAFVGEFLYWMACLLALIWIAATIYTVYTTPGIEWDTARVLATIVPAFVLFFIGRVIQYLLTGR